LGKAYTYLRCCKVVCCRMLLGRGAQLRAPRLSRLITDISHIPVQFRSPLLNTEPPFDPHTPFNQALEPRQLTWRINRTQSRKLPVYTEYRHGGTQTLTRVRGYEGNIEDLTRELQLLCGPVPIVVRDGRLQIKGIHSKKIKFWFEKLGF